MKKYIISMLAIMLFASTALAENFGFYVYEAVEKERLLNANSEVGYKGEIILIKEYLPKDIETNYPGYSKNAEIEIHGYIDTTKENEATFTIYATEFHKELKYEKIGDVITITYGGENVPVDDLSSIPLNMFPDVVQYDLQNASLPDPNKFKDMDKFSNIGNFAKNSGTGKEYQHYSLTNFTNFKAITEHFIEEASSPDYVYTGNDLSGDFIHILIDDKNPESFKITTVLDYPRGSGWASIVRNEMGNLESFSPWTDMGTTTISFPNPNKGWQKQEKFVPPSYDTLDEFLQFAAMPTLELGKNGEIATDNLPEGKSLTYYDIELLQLQLEDWAYSAIEDGYFYLSAQALINISDDVRAMLIRNENEEGYGDSHDLYFYTKEGKYISHFDSVIFYSDYEVTQYANAAFVNLPNDMHILRTITENSFEDSSHSISIQKLPMNPDFTFISDEPITISHKTYYGSIEAYPYELTDEHIEHIISLIEQENFEDVRIKERMFEIINNRNNTEESYIKNYIGYQNEQGENLILLACYANSPTLLREFIKAHVPYAMEAEYMVLNTADYNEEDIVPYDDPYFKDYMTLPISYIIAKNHQELFDILVHEAEFDVITYSVSGTIPFMFAAEYERVDMLRTLFEKAYYINFKGENEYKMSIMDYAVQSENQEIIDLVKEYQEKHK